jgi:hypothetical protein
MFEYGTKPETGEPQRARAMRRGFAVLGIPIGIWCISGGLTALGLSNLAAGLALGIAELRRNKAHR